MSRPASYFQTWENNLAAARHRYQSLYENESEDDDETYQDLPESSSSSASFVSRFSQNSAGRRLNFYPYAGPGGDEAPSDILGLLNLETSKTIAAFEVDCRTRIAQVCIAVVCCFLSSGVIFGFAALKPVLVREGVYSECSSDVCLLDFRLNLMFAIASAGFGVSALPVGAVVVTFGPRISCIIGSVFLSTGALLLAFAADLPFDGHIPGFLFLGLGGPFIYISSFHLANAFPTHSTLIRSAITGAFDSSSALFLFLSLINEANAGFSTRVFFLVYLVVPVLVLATQTMPGPYKSPAELVLQVEALRVADTNQPDQDNRETIHKIQTLLDDNESISKTISPIPAPAYPHRGFGDLPDTTSTSSGIVSQPFLLLIVFSMTQILSLNYFLVSISTQHSDYLARTFSILLPLGGLLFTPIPTYLSVTPLSSLAMLVTSSTTLGILTSIPSLTTTYLSILLYVLYRPFLFTALSDYVARVFGTRSYGLKYGILVSVSGLGNLGIPGLDVLSRVSGYAPVNILLTGLSAVTGLLVIWPAWRDRPGYLDGSEDREREREPLLEAQTQTQTQTQSYGASEM